MRKKLIEVALPLEAISVASAREKSIRHGHPSTLHLWWSRKPLAACRAVLFAQLVDDPSSRPEEFPTEEAQETERERLFEIIRNLVKWENSNNEHVLNAARAEILKSTDGNPPPVLDPFCGGGSIPLEAQRLGLEAHGSDLNPVAVLITKALIEIPPKFAGRPPVHPVKDKRLLANEWYGAQGLAEDVRYYGQWIRDEAEKRIGHLYPKATLPSEYGGGTAQVIAWLYCRAVKCPNPACGAMMPLASKFWLSTKKENPAWVKPIFCTDTGSIKFEVRTGIIDSNDVSQANNGSCFLSDKGKKIKATFKCLACNIGIAKGDYIDTEANAGRMISLPMAIVAEQSKKRIFISFDTTQIERAINKTQEYLSDHADSYNWPTETARGTFASNAQGRVYGFKTFADYFTLRQLIALTTFSNLIAEARNVIITDAGNIESDEKSKLHNDSASDEIAYSDAVVTYLALGVSRLVDICNSLCRWEASKTQVRNLFSRQAIPMLWDFAEPNLFAGAAGDFGVSLGNLIKALLMVPSNKQGYVVQADAISDLNQNASSIVSTDPPYGDNVEYSDLSDFFYVWLRRTLGGIYPNIFNTVLVPKTQELVFSPHRFGGNKEKAQLFVEDGLQQAFAKIRLLQVQDHPITVYYAFKQAEVDEDEELGGEEIVASTGWEKMLEGLLKAGFSITGTWPLRSELGNRPTASGTNALASSIVLVCRPRLKSSSSVTRREFVIALKRELPDALKKLQHGNIAPVDFAQASIGPGMAIFSRYAKVLEADGQPMSVRAALQTINQELDAYLIAQEGESDRDTRFCLAWFEQYGMNEGSFGEADVLARAKGTAVDGLVKAGVVHSKAGKVRLLKRAEYPEQWNPGLDHRVTVWECAQHLIRRLHADTGGIEAAAKLVNELGSASEDARALAYRLYSICERKKWAEEALAYNTLVVEWPAIQDKAAQQKVMPTTQADLFD
jgi:putative DNA methylase